MVNTKMHRERIVSSSVKTPLQVATERLAQMVSGLDSGAMAQTHNQHTKHGKKEVVEDEQKQKQKQTKPQASQRAAVGM